mmetsp:Transcript_29931/g.49092  ORF Transcript_29931/g.49092 Transcript_29931/m.49092 type:complete len:125 (-) Transcript_29931:179-553(-)
MENARLSRFFMAIWTICRPPQMKNCQLKLHRELSTKISPIRMKSGTPEPHHPHISTPTNHEPPNPSNEPPSTKICPRPHLSIPSINQPRTVYENLSVLHEKWSTKTASSSSIHANQSRASKLLH